MVDVISQEKCYCDTGHQYRETLGKSKNIVEHTRASYMKYTPEALKQFTETVWDYYAKHARGLPWRNAEPNGSFDPYKILVSELMLQQTQVSRAAPKYLEFIRQFPDFHSLARAPLHQ